MQGEVSYREPNDQSSLVSDLESGNGMPAINHVANNNATKKAVFFTSFVLFVAACIMLVQLMENGRRISTQYDYYSPTAPNESENKRNSLEPTQGRLKSGDFLLSKIKNDQSAIYTGLQSKLENDNIDGSESVPSAVTATTVVNDFESTEPSESLEDSSPPMTSFSELDYQSTKTTLDNMSESVPSAVTATTVVNDFDSTEPSESLEDSSPPMTSFSELDYQPTKTTLDNMGLDYTSSTQEVPLQSFDSTRSTLSIQNIGVSEFDWDEEMKSTIRSISETNLMSSFPGSSVAPGSITDETSTKLLDNSGSSELPADSSNISNDGKMKSLRTSLAVTKTTPRVTTRMKPFFSYTTNDYIKPNVERPKNYYQYYLQRGHFPLCAAILAFFRKVFENFK